MPQQTITAALQRLRQVYARRPGAALHDDPPATARWQGGTRVLTAHALGTAIASDMPVEIGGSGDQVSPGWLFRAGLAACTATCIALAAAAEGIELERLEVQARSRSDARGLLGLCDADGQAVPARARDLQMTIRLAARGVARDRLRALAESGLCRSPVYAALQGAVPVDVHIDAEVA